MIERKWYWVTLYISQRVVLALILLCCGVPEAKSQDLEYLPPVINPRNNKDTGTTLMLSTTDLARFDKIAEKKPFVNSLQIIEADQPWPPRWYAPTPVYTDEMYIQDTLQKQIKVDFVLGPQVDSGRLSFCELALLLKDDSEATHKINTVEYYVILNEKMERIDSIKSRMFDNGHVWKPNFRKDKSIERLWFSEDDTVLDLRNLTNNPGNGSVRVIVNVLHLLNNDNSFKLTWNPLSHMDLSLFKFREKVGDGSSSANRDPTKICVFDYASWDYDGDILYSIEDIGIGKISHKDGHMIWQINYRDMPRLGKDSIDWTGAIDFKLLQDNDTAGLYLLYGLVQNSPLAKGVIFEQNKKTLQLKPIKYIYPKTKFQDGQSRPNFDYNPANGNYIIGYGYFESSDTFQDSFRNVFEYGRNDSTYAIYQLPKPIYCYQASRLENYPIPPRPLIVKKGDILEADWDSNTNECIWYKMEGINNTTVTKVGKGKSINPEKGASYCVAVAYGIGFSVSKPFNTKKGNQ